MTLRAAATKMTSRRAPPLAWLAMLALAIGASAGPGLGCTSVESYEGPEPNSLRVEVLDPVDLGSMSLPIEQRDITFQVSAYLSNGTPATTFNAVLNVFVFSQGTLDPLPANAEGPTFQLAMQNGVTQAVTVSLPASFEQTVIWVEDTGPDLESGTFATGASEAIFYPFPRASDINRPRDENAPEATFQSILEGKTVYVDGSARGTLVVTGVFSQFFTATDIDPEEMKKGYNHILPFTFSAPRYSRVIGGRFLLVPLVRGQRISYVQGAVVEFNGLTELSFPSFDVLAEDVDPATGNPIPRLELVPEPVELLPDDFQQRPGADGTQEKWVKFEKLEGAIVRVRGGTVCPIPPAGCVTECAPCFPEGITFDELPLDVQNYCNMVLGQPAWPTRRDLCNDCRSFFTFGQWRIQLEGNDCDFNAVNVSTTGQAGFDAATAASFAQEMDSVTGALTSVSGYTASGGTFNIWIIRPRDDNDVLCLNGSCPGQGAVTEP